MPLTKSDLRKMRREANLSDHYRLKGSGEKLFKINLFVSKTYIEKDENGEEQWYLEGIASGTKIDLAGEFMSAGSISKMVNQLNTEQIPLTVSHWSDWNEEIGYIKQGSADPNSDMTVKVWLDKTMEDAQRLWRKAHGAPEAGIAPSKLGMSIGGWLVSGDWEVRDGEEHYRIDEVKLAHIAVTSMPAYPDAWIADVKAASLKPNHEKFAYPWTRGFFKPIKGKKRALPERSSADSDSIEDEVELILEDEKAVEIANAVLGGEVMKKKLKGLRERVEENPEVKKELEEKDENLDPDKIKEEEEEEENKEEEEEEEEKQEEEEEEDEEKEEDEEEEDNGVSKGGWITLDSIKGYSFWAMKVEEEEEEEEKEEKSVRVKTSRRNAKIIRKLAKMEETLDELAEENEELRQKLSRINKRGKRRGLGDTDKHKKIGNERKKKDEVDERTQLQKLRDTDEYKSASPPRRIQMMRKMRLVNTGE